MRTFYMYEYIYVRVDKDKAFVVVVKFSVNKIEDETGLLKDSNNALLQPNS